MMEGPWRRFRREARARENIDTVAVDSLKVLDPERPIREADLRGHRGMSRSGQDLTHAPQQKTSLLDHHVGDGE